MRINKPLTKEEIKTGDLIKPGNYPFVVEEATAEVSSKGNDMLKLKLRIFTDDGRERVVYDYIMEALEFKMAHFFEATGLYDKYANGEVEAEDCWGKSGECKIATQKDKNGIYGDKSAVMDYLLDDAAAALKLERKVEAAKAGPASTRASGDDGFGDADIPF